MLTFPLADCEIQLTEHPTPLTGPWRLDRPYWKARENCLWTRVPGIGEYLVEAGQRIAVHPLGESPDWGNLQHFLLSTPYAALSLQRHQLPLHAAALQPNGESGAILLCAHSGTGKSTTAAALCQQGWQLLNDDISRIALDQQRVIVWPGGQQIRLWPDACAQLGITTEHLALALGNKRKYLWQAPTASEPQPIRAIIELVRPLKGEVTGGWQRHSGGQIIGLVKRHTFRPPLIAALAAGNAHFKLSVAIAQQCPVFTLVVDPELEPAAVARIIREELPA